MPDIIKLLPDSVANQIAAGEVIQRPASVVKELMENAVDAGADRVQLIIKDAGKTLIQVIDNGSGMSETDARLSLERHATSKIQDAKDLFALTTMGFRGEALASMVAIAQAEIKTRRPADELGTFIDVAGSQVNAQEPCQCPIGTSIAIKNLFYNVPARRKFLKSNPVETRHIIDEFQRVALAHPEVGFSMHHNGNEVFHLEKGGFRQRVVSTFGKNFNQKLVPVEVETNIVKITGFIGKPEAAKKTRGEQFFFVNDRFIKSNYHHHAVQSAYEELIQKNHHASYFLRLETDPNSIDINIHPTKTEIKFEDERAVYAIIRSAVKQSLGKYNISPSLDFDQEGSFDVLPPKAGQEVSAPTITVDTGFNPFANVPPAKPASGASSRPPQPSVLEQHNQQHWEKLFEQKEPESQEPARTAPTLIEPDWDERQTHERDTQGRLTYQLHGKYILTHIKSGLMVIHQQLAHERILYEQFIRALAIGKAGSQQVLFPQTLELNPHDAALVHELLQEIRALGFDLDEFGQHAFILRGLPAHAEGQDSKELLEGMLEHFKNNRHEIKLSAQDNLARALARKSAVKAGKKLTAEEMANLIDELFACEMPYSSPGGKPTLTTLSLEDLDEKFA